MWIGEKISIWVLFGKSSLSLHGIGYLLLYLAFLLYWGFIKANYPKMKEVDIGYESIICYHFSYLLTCPKNGKVQIGPIWRQVFPSVTIRNDGIWVVLNENTQLELDIFKTKLQFVWWGLFTIPGILFPRVVRRIHGNGVPKMLQYIKYFQNPSPVENRRLY